MDFEPLPVPTVEGDSPASPESQVSFEPLPTGGALPASPASSFDQGYQAGVELASSQVEALASAFSQAEAARLEQLKSQATRLEAEAASLACQIASSLVDAELSLRPELILGVVEGALSDLPEAEQVTVELHPDDLALLQASDFSSPLRLTFSPDPGISPGGCRLHSVLGDVDATRETRLEQMRSRIEELTRERS